MKSYYWLLIFVIMGGMIFCSGCSRPSDVPGATTPVSGQQGTNVNQGWGSPDNAESLVKAYVNHIDNGRYEQALQMIVNDEYIHVREFLKSQYIMENLRNAGGANGEYVEITDLQISSQPASVSTYKGETTSDQQVVWSCKVNVRGKPVTSVLWNTKRYDYIELEDSHCRQ